MLRNVSDLRGYALRATDGVIGEVDDFYFDDEDWVIRYLVADTGGWLSGRKVLISPLGLGSPDWLSQMLPVSLTRAQVEKSPDIDTRKPVSRQSEAAYFGYYGYPIYWGGGGIWGMGAYPGSMTTQDRIAAEMKVRQNVVQGIDDCHLRSCGAVVRNHVHATDGDIGHVEDLIVDDHTWAIRYLVVNTGHWWSGHYVLITPQRVDGLSWPEAKVSVRLTRQAIKDAPTYNPSAQLDEQQEQGIFEHHGRPDYWTTKAAREVADSSAT